MPDAAQDPQATERARRVTRGQHFLREEGRAIHLLAEGLGDTFAEVVGLLLACRGRVGVTGVGKSGHVGAKISATLSSTGTPSFFLNPVEALHGDLGMLQPGDLLLALSNSGETAEVLTVASACRGLGVETIALTGRPESSLTRLAHATILTGVSREACPLDLAPTSSTTVTLALGDALALVLLEERGFTEEHYARYHPGGSLGERLRYRVRDLQRSGELLPVVTTEDSLADAISEMSRRENVGLTLIVSAERQLEGIFTDGDLRRVLGRSLGEPGASPGPADTSTSWAATPIRDVMSRNPRRVEATASVKDALHLMEVHGITSLATIDPAGRLEGLIHLHDILGRGKIVL